MPDAPKQRPTRPFFDATAGAASLIVTFAVIPVVGMLVDVDSAGDWLRIPLEAYGEIADALGASDARTPREMVNQSLLLIELYGGSYLVTRGFVHLYDFIRAKFGAAMGAAADHVVNRIDAVSRPRR